MKRLVSLIVLPMFLFSNIALAGGKFGGGGRGFKGGGVGTGNQVRATEARPTHDGIRVTREEGTSKVEANEGEYGSAVQATEAKLPHDGKVVTRQGKGEYANPVQKKVGEEGAPASAVQKKVGEEGAASNQIQKTEIEQGYDGDPKTHEKWPSRIEEHKGEYENVVQAIEAKTGDGDVKTREEK